MKAQLALPVIAGVTVAMWAADISCYVTGVSALAVASTHLASAATSLVWTWLLWRDAGSRAGRAVAAASGALVVAAAAIDAVWHAGAARDIPWYLVLPHILFAVALGALAVTSLLETAGWQPPRARPAVWFGALLLFWFAAMTTEYTGWPQLWRGSEFAFAAGLTFAAPLVLTARVAPQRWAATAAAAIYGLLGLALATFLRAIPVGAGTPGTPSHLVVLPGSFLLLLPGMLADWYTRPRVQAWRPAQDGLAALVMGIGFTALLWISHWPLAPLLMGVAGSGSTLGLDHGFGAIRAADWQHDFWTLDASRAAWMRGMAFAIFGAAASARLGYWIGSGWRRGMAAQLPRSGG